MVIYKKHLTVFLYYSLPPLTRHRKGNENSVELAGVELAGEKANLFNPAQFLSQDVFLIRAS